MSSERTDVSGLIIVTAPFTRTWRVEERGSGAVTVRCLSMPCPALCPAEGDPQPRQGLLVLTESTHHLTIYRMGAMSTRLLSAKEPDSAPLPRRLLRALHRACANEAAASQTHAALDNLSSADAA